MRTLEGRVAIVTGASRGIGRAMALALGRRGAMVVAAARTLGPGPGSLEETVGLLEAAGGTGLAIPVDVREETQVEWLMARVMRRYRQVDLLVNNAGLMLGERGFTEISPSQWREVMDTNLWGAFLCCHHVVPAMVEREEGVIVNVSSGAAVRTGFLNIPYGVSKAGLDRLTLGLAAELADHGIACVSLSPSVTATNTVRRLYPGAEPVENWAQPPEMAAEALCALVEGDPMRHSGQVVTARQLLEDGDG